MDHKKSPFEKSNLFQFMFFTWVTPIFRIGNKRNLTEDDLFELGRMEQTKYLISRIEKQWKKELKKEKPSYTWAAVRAFGPLYIITSVFITIEESLNIISPLLLGQLLDCFEDLSSGNNLRDAYLYASGIGTCALCYVMMHHPYFFRVSRFGMWMRVCSSGMMYKKILRLNQKALSQTTTGQIINLMTNDVQRFDTGLYFLNYIWLGPVAAVMVMFVLYQRIGVASVAGVAGIILLTPLQSGLGKIFAKLRYKTAVLTDERVKLVSEIVNSMRVIKVYCWEKMFSQLVHKVRSQEIAVIKRGMFFQAVLISQWLYQQKLAVLTALGVYVLYDHPITAANVFLVSTILSNLRVTLILFLPKGVTGFYESRISLRRIEKFLLLPEYTTDNISSLPESGLPSVGFENFSTIWDDQQTKNVTLDDINFTIEGHPLVAVVGPVGSGKSSLLMALLSELPGISGRVFCRGRVAFTSQQPWVLSASIRENILFGMEYEEERYQNVLACTAIEQDLESMPHGDLTLVGERGVSLSGGQRARVALARAVYAQPDILLLDDPLSAVDVKTSKHIFELCLCGRLANTLRVLVTHQLQYLQAADLVIILEAGRIAAQGTFSELCESGVDFTSLLRRADPEHSALSDSAISWEEGSLPDVSNLCPRDRGLFKSLPHLAALDEIYEMGSLQSLPYLPQEKGSRYDLDVDAEEVDPKFSTEKLDKTETTPEETHNTGNIKWRLYAQYFTAGSGWLVLILVALLHVLTMVVYVLSDFWLSRWSQKESAHLRALDQLNISITNTSTEWTPLPDVNRRFYVVVFALLCLGIVIISTLRSTIFYMCTTRSNRNLHRKMFSRLMRAPIRFFDVNPAGRILNRYSKDVGLMDDMLPLTMGDFLQCFFLLFGALMVTIISNAWILIPVLPLLVMFLLLRRYYLATSRSVKRLESVGRSPIFSHVTSTLHGLVVLRSAHQQDRFIVDYCHVQDQHSKAYFTYLSTVRWFGQRLDFLAVGFIYSVALSCVIVGDRLNSGLVGLVLAYTMGLVGLFQWCVRQSAEVENQMVSVERVVEYTQLEEEAAWTSPPDQGLPPNWPPQGSMQFNQVSLNYFEGGPRALDDISFQIAPREKVGIVGRTGAGKSSLMSALLRLAEPEGSITIDNVDVLKIGLHELRQKISVIPQDPLLFTGSIRLNLDPFNQCEDEDIWRALEEVQLKSAIRALTNGLNCRVNEGGTNLSVGQRQLLCLARALLRQNRILLIDEATANVDPHTDGLIQETIRTKFADCTVLTIAHRLHTIMDSDRVLLLDVGHVVESGPPHELLEKGGYFLDLVKQAGPLEAKHLKAIARASYYMRDAPTELDLSKPITTDRDDLDKEYDDVTEVTRMLPANGLVGANQTTELNGSLVRSNLSQ